METQNIALMSTKRILQNFASNFVNIDNLEEDEIGR